MFKSFSKAYRSLHLFSGEDYHIIQNLNNPKINRNFNIIGFCVLMISILCLFSAGFFMYNIFEGVGKFMSIPIGLFWGFTVTTIYISLLYTITPPLLIDRTMVQKKRKKFSIQTIYFNNAKRIGEWLSFSMILRLIFILVFAVIIAQPFNVLFFGKLVKPDIEAYRMQFKAEMILNSDSIKIVEEQKLHSEFNQKLSLRILSKIDSIQQRENLSQIDEKINRDSKYLLQSIALHNSLKKLENKFDKKSKVQKENSLLDFHQLALDEIESDSNFLVELEEKSFSNTELQTLYADYSEKVKQIIDEKNVYHQKTVDLIDKNNFYLRQIIMLNSKTLVANLLNFLSLALFIFPIYLKFQIRKVKPDNEEVFYKYKEKFERELVVENYLQFKDNFEKILARKNAIAREKIIEKLSEPLAQLQKFKPDSAAKIRKKIEKKYNRKFTFYEKYLDPPFNLRDKKKNIIEMTEQSFINEVWKTEEIE